MLSWLPAPIIGMITLIFFGLDCIFLPLTFFLVFFLYLITPVPSWRRGLEYFANEFPRYWGSLSGIFNCWVTGMKLEIRGKQNLNRHAWYLMLPNHQSFSDIMVLHFAFGNNLPSLRFFMKQSLRWIPIIGQVCVLLGYPFMRRYTKSQVAKNPSLKGKDLEATKKACERFKRIPVTIISFVEGTRFTPKKAKRQNTPFKYLLKPRAGGIAFTLSAMSQCLQEIVHVSIVYDTKYPVTFWNYYSGRIKKIIIDIKVEPITPNLIGDYVNDREFRVNFQEWLNQAWMYKDQRIAQIKKELHG